MIGMNLLNRTATNHPPSPRRGSTPGFKTTVEHGETLGIDLEIVTKDDPPGERLQRAQEPMDRRAIHRLAEEHRRLVRDYEARPDNSASMITIAMIDNLTERLTEPFPS